MDECGYEDGVIIFEKMEAFLCTTKVIKIGFFQNQNLSFVVDRKVFFW